MKTLLFVLVCFTGAVEANELQRFVDQGELAGAVTLVATPEKVLDAGVVGYSDLAARKPVRADDVFWIASMSKSVIAAAVMILADEGKLNVDDPVAKYLPEFKDQWMVAEEAADHLLLRHPAHPITIRNLLTHTSGVTRRSAVEWPAWDILPLANAAMSYAITPLRFEPGSQYEYSNGGMNTAARIVEVVGGMPYQQFLWKRLFQPLGMKDTTFFPSEAQVRRLAKSYRWNKEKRQLDEIPIEVLTYPLTDPKRQPLPAGGLFSTAQDIAQFCRMILGRGSLDGKRILSPAAIRQMTTVQTGDLVLNGIKDIGYGFGWQVLKRPRPDGLHAGDFFHAGAYLTGMWVLPERQLVLVLMLQRRDDATAPGGNAIREHFLKETLERYGPTKDGKTMKITDIRLFRIRGGTSGEKGARFGESQYWGGGWQTNALIANPMTVYPEYARVRTLWMGPGQDPYAIEIHTDEGVTGVAANYGGGPFACGVIDQHFRRFLIGQDPFNIERIWDQMYRSTMPYGLGGVTAMAMSGVDLALWDLMGKALNQPVYRLIGGKTKDEIPCYVTVHPDQAGLWKDRGFLGVKIAAPWGAANGREGLLRMQKCVENVRTAIGDPMELMIDCYMSWDIEFSSRLAARVRDCDVKWFEDPLPNGWAESANLELRSRINPIQVAIGNLEFDYKAYYAILERHACDVIQPEMQWCGGLTAVRRIAAIARPFDIPVIPHGSGVYNYHFVISNVNSPFAEFLTVASGEEVRPIFDAVVGEPLPVNGRVTLSDKPGFGVELNPDYLEPYQP